MAERGDPLLRFRVRPERIVELETVPDEDTQGDIGVSRDYPLEAGTQLFGSSNRRSLFCYALNDRLVGSTGTCLRDFDNDGAFEQGVKLEAPGLDTDVVIPRTTGSWYGGTFVDRTRLSPALTYREVEPDESHYVPAHLYWEASERRPTEEDYPIGLRLNIVLGERGENSDVIGECTVLAAYDGSLITIPFYGNYFTIFGFTEDGDLRYGVETNPDEATVGFIYQFETRNPYVAMALARNAPNLACGDVEATRPQPIDPEPATPPKAPTG